MASVLTKISSQQASAALQPLQYNPRSPRKVNVGLTERWFSSAGGGLFILSGLVRRDLIGGVLALLGGVLTLRGVTGHSYLYQALDINTVDESPRTVMDLPGQGVRVRRTLTIERSPQDLYQCWRDVTRAPLYMDTIVQVTTTGERTSHWIMKDASGLTLEWDSTLTEDVPGQRIAWQTTGNSLMGHSGRITFTPAPVPDKQGTVVTLEVDFQQSDGVLGMIMARLPGRVFGHLPEQQIRETLRHFKELMEAGEVPTIKGQPTGEGRK